MKPLVIYHANCMDGAAAALAAWLKFGDEAEYRPASYGDPAPTDDEVRGRDVYVLDFSYPRAELVRIRDKQKRWDLPHYPGGNLVVIDHRKTAQAALAGLPFCWFRMDFSGSVMAWMQFHGKGVDGEGRPSALDVPELFAYVQDRDLWRWELPHSREVSAALAASGALTDFRALIPIYEKWNELVMPGNALVDAGAAILRAERLHVECIVSTAEEVEILYPVDGSFSGRKNGPEDFKTVRALAATSAVLKSKVGEALAIKSAHNGRDAVGIVYYRDGAAGKWMVEMRSRDTDVAFIAEIFGGGGHANAAGFECDRLPWVVPE